MVPQVSPDSAVLHNCTKGTIGITVHVLQIANIATVDVLIHLRNASCFSFEKLYFPHTRMSITGNFDELAKDIARSIAKLYFQGHFQNCCKALQCTFKGHCHNCCKSVLSMYIARTVAKL